MRYVAIRSEGGLIPYDLLDVWGIPAGHGPVE